MVSGVRSGAGAGVDFVASRMRSEGEESRFAELIGRSGMGDAGAERQQGSLPLNGPHPDPLPRSGRGGKTAAESPEAAEAPPAPLQTLLPSPEAPLLQSPPTPTGSRPVNPLSRCAGEGGGEGRGTPEPPPLPNPPTPTASRPVNPLSRCAGEGGGEGRGTPEPPTPTSPPTLDAPIPPRPQPIAVPPSPAGALPPPSATLQALARATGPLPRQWQLEITTGHQAPLTLHAERNAGWSLSVQLPAAQPVNAAQLDRLATRLTRSGIPLETLRADGLPKPSTATAPASRPLRSERSDDDSHDDAFDDARHDRRGRR